MRKPVMTNSIWTSKLRINIEDLGIGVTQFRHFKNDPSVRELALWALQELELLLREKWGGVVLNFSDFRIVCRGSNCKPSGVTFRASIKKKHLLLVSISANKEKAQIYDNIPLETYLTDAGKQTRILAKKICNKEALNISNEQLEIT